MAVGLNYHEHAQEFHDCGFDATSGTTAVPEDPIIFTKATTSVSGPFDPIPSYLDNTHSTDYEGELAVIIGKAGRGILKSDAFQYVYIGDKYPDYVNWDMNKLLLITLDIEVESENGFPDAQKADEKLLCITVKNHSNKAIICLLYTSPSPRDRG